MTKKFTLRITVLTIFLVLGLPVYSWALQPHGPPEGLYVHQMAHILFVGALAYLYLHTRSTPDLISKGWWYLRLFCLLSIAWNIIAFTGHIVVIHHSHRASGAPLDILEIVYILTRMDHFLYVPALFALMICLRTFYREAREGQAK
ncbi:MAG: hypothetical protein V1706_12575 [Pseudomonadota bacterium]